MKKKFEFSIGESVALAASKEKGRVIGRAKYETGMRQYLIRYVAADGRQEDAWFETDALHKADAVLVRGDLISLGPGEEPFVLLPHMKISGATIESAKLKEGSRVAKPDGEELEAINCQLGSLRSCVAGLQANVSNLEGQFAVLADRFSVSAQ